MLCLLSPTISSLFPHQEIFVVILLLCWICLIFIWTALMRSHFLGLRLLWIQFDAIAQHESLRSMYSRMFFFSFFFPHMILRLLGCFLQQSNLFLGLLVSVLSVLLLVWFHFISLLCSFNISYVDDAFVVIRICWCLWDLSRRACSW